MIRRLVKALFIGTAALTVLVAASSPSAAGPSNAPVMIGSAGAPISVTFGAPVVYVVTQTDKDTDGANVQFIDTTCTILPWAIYSMANPVYSLRGVEADGKYTWDISGTAVAIPGKYTDTWRLVNQRPQGDVYLDLLLDVNQKVEVIGRPPP